MNLKRLFYLVAASLAAAMVLCGSASALSAQHAVVMDARTGQTLFAQQEDCRCLIASTTKIMTGLLICEDCDLQQTYTIPKEAEGVEGSSIYLHAGEQLTLEDLLYGMMLQSGNDAAVALALAHSGSIEAFAARMNARAMELGLQNTHFANPHGLDDAGNYATAADLARLACAAMENETFAKVVSTKQYRFGQRVVTNHNKLLWRFEGAEGVKTGFTKAAGRILVSSATRQGRRLICVTINAPDDWNDHCALLEEGFSKFRLCQLCRKGQIFGAVMAPDGTLRGYAASAQDVAVRLLPGETVDEVRVIVGDSAENRAEFLSDGDIIAVCPLVTIGETDGGAHSENYSGAGASLPPGGGGTDPGRTCTGEREHRIPW